MQQVNPFASNNDALFQDFLSFYRTMYGLIQNYTAASLKDHYKSMYKNLSSLINLTACRFKEEQEEELIKELEALDLAFSDKVQSTQQGVFKNQQLQKLKAKDLKLLFRKVMRLLNSGGMLIPTVKKDSRPVVMRQ